MIVLQSNDARGNELIAFTRELEPAWRAATGGRGTGTPHLPSQGSIATDGERLLVANAGSDDVSLFSAAGELLVLAPAGGERPVSIALRGDRAFVLNAGTASINGLTVGTRSLDQLPRSLYALPDGADPAQIAFAPDGESLIVSDRAGNSIVSIALDEEGLPRRPEIFPATGKTPSASRPRTRGAKCDGRSRRRMGGTSGSRTSATGRSRATETVAGLAAA